MGVFAKLGEGIADLSELQVQTITGELVTTIKSDKPGMVLDWQKLIKAAKTQSEGAIKLAAATNVKFDGDIDQFFSDSATERTLKAHADAVESGRKIREGLIAMFKGALNLE